MEYEMAYMTQMTVGEAIEQKRPVIVPTGATEAHGPHMPTDTDTHQAGFIAFELAKKINALVAPTVAYGISKTFEFFYMNLFLIHPQMYPKLVIGQKANLYAKFPVKLVSSCVLIVLSKLNLKKWSSVIFLSKPRLVARVTSCVVSLSCEKVAAVPLIS